MMISNTISYSQNNLGDDDVVYDIFRNDSNKGSGETVNLAVGNYDYILNSTGGQNYSASANLDSEILGINKANPTTNMQLSITPSNNEDYGTETSAQVRIYGGNADLTYSLYRNNVLRTTLFPWTDTATLNAGTYDYVFNTTGGENYTEGSVNATLIITKFQIQLAC